MTGTDSTYFKYYKISSSSYREKVRFYEENESRIENLEESKKIEIYTDYIFALFEIGKYQAFLNRVDNIIEAVVMENIYVISGKNIFEELLFCKGACLYNLERYEMGCSVIEELIKINTNHLYAQRLYRKILRRKGFNWYEINKAIAVVFLLSAISVTLAKLLIIDTFYEKISAEINVFRLSLFLISGTLLIINEFWIRLKCYYKVMAYSKK
jgi:hypothetical protein